MFDHKLPFILCALLGAASALAEDARESFPAVVFGHFTRGEYLPEPDDDDCDAMEKEEYDDDGKVLLTYCISLDPPPMLLEFEVSGVVHGTVAEKRLRLISTSHYGLRSFALGEESSVAIVLVGREGGMYSMPPYAQAEIQPTTDGDWAIPLNEPRSVPWLPCSMQEKLERIEWSHAVRSDIKDWSAEELEAHKDFIEVDAPWVYFTHGLRLRKLQAALQGLRLGESSGCD